MWWFTGYSVRTFCYKPSSGSFSFCCLLLYDLKLCIQSFSAWKITARFFSTLSNKEFYITSTDTTLAKQHFPCLTHSQTPKPALALCKGQAEGKENTENFFYKSSFWKVRSLICLLQSFKECLPLTASKSLIWDSAAHRIKMAYVAEPSDASAPTDILNS